MVDPIKPARVVEQGILRSEGSTSTQNGEGPRNSTGYASLPALRSLNPLGPTPPASTALAAVSVPLWCLAGSLNLATLGQEI